jgi:thioredoxin reductase
MEQLMEELSIYGVVFLFIGIIIFIYLRKQRRESKAVEEKIRIAKEEGLFEPVSLHPVVDPNSCIKTGACIAACPEKDILGIQNGKARPINASRCIGHGACFHACPTEAITLMIGTEKRGVDLPHINHTFETNVKGIFIAGELGGMGLIKNAVEQGRQAAENLIKSLPAKHHANYDLIIIGAGPAGISASLTAKKHKLKALTLEQDTLGGTVFTFPRSKIVMTSPMDLPLYGKVKLSETSKGELLEVWNKALSKNEITIREKQKVEAINAVNDHFELNIKDGETLTSARVLIAIGRRGTPRKLGIPGENTEKVAYRLLEPEDISGEKIMVVGGGDSAIESAMLLAEQNEVILSYRKEKFSRIKPKNSKRITQMIEEGKIDVRYKTNLVKIEGEKAHLKNEGGQVEEIPNDRVYIFAGGELPTQFLKNAGITITKKFGEAILSHKK